MQRFTEQRESLFVLLVQNSRVDCYDRYGIEAEQRERLGDTGGERGAGDWHVRRLC